MTTTTLPPIDWFRNPQLEALTPLTVTDEGRVYGHLAGWGTSHTSFPGRRISPPRSRTDYSYFHTGALQVQDGEQRREISVGHLTMGTGHADTSLGHHDTASWYDNTGSVAASVCVGEDEHGVWFAGAVEPDMDELRLRRFRGCALSGDWRRIDGAGLELVAVLSVPTPGFPIPRARVASGAPLALVAAGAVPAPAQVFGKRVAPGWAPAAGGEPVGAGLLDYDTLADRIATLLEEKRAAGELSARHAALVAELDDTPAVVAALLAEVDDSPQRAAELLAELDDDEDGGDFNWVDDVGGLPKYIKRISDHLEAKGMDKSRAIATAVNAAKRMCSTGDLNFPGKQEVNPGSRAEACAAVADWERKKVQARGD